METWNPTPSPEEVAKMHSQEMLDAVARANRLVATDLCLLPQSAFADPQDGSVSVYVHHVPTGCLYGVNAFPSPDGTLMNLTTVDLQKLQQEGAPES